MKNFTFLSLKGDLLRHANFVAIQSNKHQFSLLYIYKKTINFGVANNSILLMYSKKFTIGTNHFLEPVHSFEIFYCWTRSAL